MYTCWANYSKIKQKIIFLANNCEVDGLRTAFIKAILEFGQSCSVKDALQMMAEKDVGALLVVDQGGKPTGIFSERDYARKVALEGKSSKVRGWNQYSWWYPLFWNSVKTTTITARCTYWPDHRCLPKSFVLNPHPRSPGATRPVSPPMECKYPPTATRQGAWSFLAARSGVIIHSLEWLRVSW